MHKEGNWDLKAVKTLINKIKLSISRQKIFSNRKFKSANRLFLANIKRNAVPEFGSTDLKGATPFCFSIVGGRDRVVPSITTCSIIAARVLNE